MKIQHIPNLITLLRIVLMFPIAWGLTHEHYQLAFYLFILAGASDSFDGLLARRYGWISELGTFIDPIADKCVIIVILGSLAWLNQLPRWLFLIIMVRDVWVIAGACAYRYLIGPLVCSPLLTSKISTFFQLLLITLLLFQLAFSPLPRILLSSLFYIIMLTTLVSGLHYTVSWSLKAIKEWRIQHGS